MFESAKPVFIKGRSREMNHTAGFICKFSAKSNAVYSLKMTASSLCRVFLDGTFLHYGPARGPHGWVRVDEIELHVSEGEHTLSFEVAGYYCASFYSIRLVSFLQAELLENNAVIAYTGRDFSGTSLTSLREQYVPRYSYQRTFTEVYDYTSPLVSWMSGDFEPQELEEITHGCDFLPRVFAVPDFSVTPPAAFERGGTYIPTRIMPACKNRFLIPSDAVCGYVYEDCPHDVFDATIANFSVQVGEPAALTAGRFAEYSFPRINTGFICADLSVIEPAVLYIVFGENRNGDDISYADVVHGETLNVIKYILPVGRHRLESFEAYSLKYIGVMVESGKVCVNLLSLREYSYPTKPFSPNTGDSDLDRILETCHHAFRQNTLDCFMDCPGRERGGWLCDSYFTAQASLYFTGSLDAEQAYLDNFRLAKYFPCLPKGILPMCYPGDILVADTIPQWTMWYVAQLYEFGKRGGDVAPFETLVKQIFAFFEQYENEDGLLEALPFWNFVEWSKANDWVRDVNYPTNMLYSYILKNASEMYGWEHFAKKSEQLRQTIISQSFDGKYFRDHAVRQNGQLTVLDDRSAICQHEAFLFDIADGFSAFSELKQDLIENMSGTDGKTPEGMEPIDLFIGCAVRVEVLMKLGCYQQNVEEIKRLYLHMAKDTGTIWEHKAKINSLNHGFGSFVAAKLEKCLNG